MIPQNITKEHILKAIQEIDKNGVPEERLSTKYYLKYNGKNYPPKYTISLANKYANGRELDPSTFSGGDETNPFLKARGFDIVLMSDALDTEELKEALQEQEHDFAPVLKRYLEDKFSIKVNKIGRANLQLPSRTVIHGKGSKNYSKDPRTKIYWFGLDEDIFNEFITNPKFFLCIVLDNPATTYVLPKNIVLKIFKGKPTKKRPGRDTERWLFAIRIKEDKCILKLNNVDEVNDITPFLNKWEQIDDFKNSGVPPEALSPSSDTYLLLRKEKPIDYNDPEFDAGPDNPNRSRLRIGANVVIAGRKGEQTVLYGYGQIKSLITKNPDSSISKTKPNTLTAKIGNFVRIDPPMLQSSHLYSKLISLPGYNDQASINVITGDIFELVKGYTESTSPNLRSTWLKDLTQCFINLGGKGKYYHLDQIYDQFAKLRKASGATLPRDYKAIIRYYIQENSRGKGHDLFEPKELGSGLWMLKRVEGPQDTERFAMNAEIQSCFQTFPRNEDKRRIEDAKNELTDFQRSYPYKDQPSLIDALKPDDIYRKGSENSLLYRVVYKSPVGSVNVGSSAPMENASKDYQRFKELLKIVIDPTKTLAEKVDAPWDSILGFGGDRQIAKKIIYLFNPETSIAVYSTDHMENFLSRLGKDYLDKAHEKYGKGYSELTIGEKHQLLTEMLLETKIEIDPNWDTTTFHRFLYSCVRYDLEEQPPRPEEVLGDDQILPLPSNEQLNVAIATINKILMVEENVIRQIVSNLIAGKHILLAGPIGTGKTHLARLIPEIVWYDYDGGYYSEVVTATADWTTQNVIGGIYPKIDESEEIVYTVQKGCVADTVSKNWVDGKSGIRRKFQKNGKTYRGIWLIIDEFNRANIDRAFGEMITAMEHGGLKIPTTDESLTYEELAIPKDYRIIATLNTFDKHYLFRLSDALKRRFAYIEVLPPRKSKAENEKYYILKRSLEDLSSIQALSDKVTLDQEKKEIIREKTDAALLNAIDALHEMFLFVRLTKDLGTAVMISMCKFILVDSLLNNKIENSVDNALISNLVPQLESLQKPSLEVIRAFCCDSQVTSVFKNHNPTQIDGRGYEVEFRKLLQYLGKDNISTKVQRYVRGEIKQDDEWAGYEPWTNKYRPNLPNFRRALDELLLDAEII